MKKLFLLSFFAFAVPVFMTASRPDSIFVGGQMNHVQGLVYDESVSKMYFSLTTRFVVSDNAGQVLGSVDKIHGHLGAMTFDKAGRKVYASLECKDDEIGSSISKHLGVEGFTESAFYIAEIDVDAINGPNIPQEDVIRRLDLPVVNEDYKAEVTLDGRTYKHRYGCTGIDGITIGPDFGGKGGEFLYVAYGIKSDTTRTDNDYQILLQYKMSDIRKGNSTSPRRFFVKTGNTTYGVQNLAYDSFSGRMYMAVYKGKKSQWPNYDLFAIDMAAKPVSAKLDGVPYEKKAVKTIPLAREGWYFKYGAMGMYPLGDGYWYIAEGGQIKDEVTGKKLSTCNLALYIWNKDGDVPFSRTTGQ